MLINYFKTAFRNFYRHLTYTSINILGLTIGIATSIFIYLWIADELAYEKHYADADQIFAIVSNFEYSDGRLESTLSTNGLLADALQRDFPEVQSASRADWISERLIRVDEKSSLQKSMLVDKTIFEVFGFQVLAGDKQNPLPDKKAIVLTESTARKLFPKGEAIGKTVRLDERHDLMVTAIIKDQKNSQLNFDFLASYEYILEEHPWILEWSNRDDRTFVKLRSQAEAKVLNAKLNGYIQSKCKDCDYTIWLQPFADTRLYDRYENGKADGGRIEYIHMFALTGAFILFIACINFMNLSTARSATRSREVGVRKVVGAHRKSLIFQFMGESLMLAFLALLLALVVVQGTLPIFNYVTEKQVFLDFKNIQFISALLALVVITGIVSGSYPSLFLSAFKPVLVLKGNIQNSLSGNRLRKALVVFQFVLSIVLIISSVVVFRQVGFIKNKNLGFNRDNVLTIRMHDNLTKSRDAFKTQILQNPAIRSVSFAGQDPFSVSWNTTSVVWPGKADNARVSFNIISSDKDLISTLGLTLIAGRNFSDDFADSTNYIVNEKALQVMGITDPVGAPLNVWEKPSGRIIGVVKDFHNGHFSKAITPQILIVSPENTWTVFAKIEADKTSEAIAHLEKVYKNFEPFYPFEYQFLNDKFNNQYKLENTTEKVALYFTLVAVTISCLGLFGLASFTAERRTKELGVRKVLGASVANLVSMLCSDFARLVMIAILIACPVAYYLMNSFLQEYAYHIDLSWMIFAGSGLLILFIAFTTVFYQSLRAALINPVKSLRSE